MDHNSSSSELVSIYAVSFIVGSYLFLSIDIQISNVTWTKNYSLN